MTTDSFVRHAAVLSLCLAISACGSSHDGKTPITKQDAATPPLEDAGQAGDGDGDSEHDSGTPPHDAGPADAGMPDAHTPPVEQDAGTPDADGPCAVAGRKRVFVTSAIYSGDLKTHGKGDDGLQGADNLCNLAAAAANLGGTWTAWLSSSTADAIDRIADVGPWYLVDQCTRVFANKASVAVSGPEVGIDLTEQGVMPEPYNAWTGTDETGRADPFNCNEWTNDQPIHGYEGRIGLPESTSTFWTASSSNPCDGKNRLYCFEQ